MRKVVTIQLEGKLPQSQSAYEVAVEEGYEGSEEQYGKELATIPPTQEQFDAIPGRVCKVTNTTEKSDFHHITDSAADGVLDFGMEGKTEQDTTEGNQLFDISQLELVTANNIGITEVGDDYVVITSYDGYTGNGIISTGKTLRELCPLLEVGGTYLLTATTESSTMARIYVGTAWNFGSTAVITEDMLNATVILYGHSYSSTIGSCKISNIQIQKGDTATDYEPYTNGPSPNPDYPQPIVNAGVYNEETGRYEHKFTVGNKNLLKLTGRNIIPEQESLQTVAREFTGNQIFIGISANNYCQKKAVDNYSIDNNSITLTTSGGSYGLGFDVPVKEGQTYIISDDNNNDNIKVGFFDSAGNWLSYLTLAGKTFTTPTNTSWMLVVFLSNTTTEVNITNIQLELDTVATEPVIHASQQLTLTSPVPLTKWDYLMKRDGVWGWCVWNLSYIFDGSENWVYSNSRMGFSVDCFPDSYTYRFGYCNQLMHFNGSYGAGQAPNNSFWCGAYNSRFNAVKVSFYDESLGDYGLANWKAHLNENPLEIITYADEEQAFYPLPDEEQTLLNNLETYYGVTNMYNDQGCPMWLTYVQDTKTAVDNKFENIKNAIISLGGNV